jgi:putative toxin-antitoxin system antitoxin component (TIGR02293 family)
MVAAPRWWVDALPQNGARVAGQRAGRTVSKDGTLNSEETAKLVRLARVVGRAEEVFEGLDATPDWLKSPHAKLARATPLSLLDTDIGAESALDTLGRIEQGVFA